MIEPRERFDPPLLRARWTLDAPLSRAALLDGLRARTSWDASRIESLLWHGGLHLDGRPHRADDLPDAIAAGTRVAAWAFAHEPERVALDASRVIADGSDWLAADKPAFVTTQRSRASARLSLEASLREITRCASLVAVHRLDRETSGVVLFAKTREAAARLGRAFAEGAVRKRYLAVASPPPKEAEWEVVAFLGRVLDPQRYRFALRNDAAPGFRASHTRFTTLSRDGERALVACEPTTGRPHQIRVHLAAGGTPIVGDALYGGDEAARTMLHASELSLAEGTAVPSLRAPLPRDFERQSQS